MIIESIEELISVLSRSVDGDQNIRVQSICKIAMTSSKAQLEHLEQLTYINFKLRKVPISSFLIAGKMDDGESLYHPSVQRLIRALIYVIPNFMFRFTSDSKRAASLAVHFEFLMFSEETMRVLCPALREAKHLKIINFHGCRMLGTFADQLLPAISRHSVEHLRFHDCDFYSGKELAYLIAHSFDLKEVDIDCNPIPDPDVALLFSAAEKSFSPLKTLALSKTRIAVGTDAIEWRESRAADIAARQEKLTATRARREALRLTVS